VPTIRFVVLCDNLIIAC